MLLAVDIGNTSVKFGLFAGDTLTSKFSIPTKRNATPDEIRFAIDDRIGVPVDAAIVCSVVPDIETSIVSFIRETLNVEPTFVTNSFDFGLKINYNPLDSLGTDRLVAAFAAAEKYGAPCVVCSLGTATTIDVVSANREFLGGIIAPGMDAMADALHLKTAKLPDIDVSEPKGVIGNSTVDSIRAGVYHGYVAMVEGLICKVGSEFGVQRIVITGGNAKIISDTARVVDVDLLLDGLRLLR